MSILKESIKTLCEAPLPDDWDKSVYTPKTSFKSKIDYAVQQAQKVGSGSSRVAFAIDYQGRKTVLKIAKNNKGLAQNEAEARILDDYYLKRLGLFIPLIDYDEEHNKPIWIHTEFATKATAANIKAACGGSLDDLIAWAKREHGHRKPWFMGDPDNINPESDLAESFSDYVGSYDPELGDYNRLANWGMYHGHPVIIDAGFDADTKKLYS